jgi:type IV secretion system protein VirB9
MRVGTLPFSLGLPFGALLVALQASVGIAQDRFDSRIQIVEYQPAGTMALEAALGRHMVLMFAADESIVTASIGDSATWQISTSDERTMLFVRPLALGETTNLIVVTNVRTYVFDLTASANVSATTAYTVRFRYPAIASPFPDATSAEIDPVVGRYEVSGAELIAPMAIDDDGRSTFIEWASGAPLPATFFIDANGNEALANGQMRGNRYVLDRVAERLVFRLDRRVARARRVGEERPER